jgi:phage shock protein A
MFQTILTLVRGAYAEQEEVLQNGAALPLLRQQIREAASALDTARRDLAAAIAALKGEQRALSEIDARIGTLSTSARKALIDGREDLALKASVQIAALEDDRAERTIDLHKRDAAVQEQRAIVARGQARLRRLGEGYRRAQVDASLRRAGLSVRQGVTASTGKLAVAEATLARLEERSGLSVDFDEALQSIDDSDDAAATLARAGYGPTQKTDPESVLARLKAEADRPQQ